METYVALLRGINVGGKNMIKMSELRSVLTDAGLEAPQTLLQSGNVVFRSNSSAPELERSLETITYERFKINPFYFVRSAQEWDSMIERNPFREFSRADPSHLLVHFFKEELDSATVEEVSAKIAGPEKMVAIGRELFVTYPEGIGTSKIGKTPGWTRLTTNGTGRNWNTVLKLATLCSGGG